MAPPRERPLAEACVHVQEQQQQQEEQEQEEQQGAAAALHTHTWINQEETVVQFCNVIIRRVCENQYMELLFKPSVKRYACSQPDSGCHGEATERTTESR
ncbi:hypothetical protein JOB18_001313 [Solea senegalensis]|uniref:Uncharacterized protein n=1 Tax=Solea senegalensis TaxID=28829 RepID=A0AAV6S614_SOLSE|nr:hypothetical protein JOB18_001313 [Solea senegalensis]